MTMKAFLVTTTAVAWICFVVVLVMVQPKLNQEQAIRRRLTFFDPKSVEYKDGSLQPKNSTWTKKTKKKAPLFNEGLHELKSSTNSKSTAPGDQMSAGKQPVPSDKEENKPTKSIETRSSPNGLSIEPSYMRLCRELIARTERGGGNEDSFIVYESPEICNSRDSFAALTYIMLSAAISQAGSKARLVYQHNCTVSDRGTSTIQQWLPRDLTFGVGIGQLQIQQKCTACLSSEHFTECMGMPIAGVMSEPVDPMTTSFRIAGFRHNIYQAVQDMRKAEVMHEIPSPTYGGAVIVLDLEKETSGRSWALPLYFYEDLLPANVSSIAILTTQRCIDNSPTCKHHGNTLTEGLAKLYPSAKVYAETLVSTSMAYARIMDAPQLICPSTMFCILPSLYNEYSKASYHVMNSNLYEWFKYIARENRKLMGKQLVIFEQDDVKTKALTESADDLDNFLHRKRPNPVQSRRRLTMVSDPKTIVLKQESRVLSLTPTLGVDRYASGTFDDHGVAPGYSLDPHVPSYVHLCRELLNRRHSSQFETRYVVHESLDVCYSPDSFQSLITMIISSIVAHAGSALRLSYQHNCPSPDNIKTATIQQLLPAALSIAKGIGIDAALDRCSACVTQPGDVVNIVQCFGFPIPGPMVSEPTSSARMLQPFRHNIEAAVAEVRRLEAGDRPPTNAGVVIYLDTDSEMSTDVYQVPMKYYAEIIPRDISTITIVVSLRCNKCADFSVFTKEYLHLMYPTARIEVENISGSAVGYARVMEAPFNICSPSMFCILPALFKEFSHKSHIIMHPHLYPWLKTLVTETGDMLNKFVFLHDEQPVRPVVALNDMKKFLFEQADPASVTCADLRGRLGEWTQDLDYGKFAQYVTPLKRFQSFNFTPTKEMPYRLATTYRWIDALCPIYLTEKDRLCSVLSSLSLTRIYIVGDSLGMQMAQSLWKLLGNEDDPYTTKVERFQWNRVVDCPSQPHGIEIVYTRNDLLNDNDEKDLHKRIGDRDFNCGFAEFCLPWIRNYAEYSKGGTLLVTNVGTHVHDIDVYRGYLDNFFHLLDSYRKPNDVVMLRTTPPGHENCQDPDVKPLRNYDEYLQKHFISDFKSYHLFPTFNKMAEERVRDRPGIYILDVVPMTVLRPDGHTSGPQKCSACKNDDCLHYMLPGPTDWWNHLMYSNLISLGAARKAIN